MKNPLSLLRVLSIVVLVCLFVWIALPEGVVAGHRTYTAEYVPDRITDGFDFPVGANGSAKGYYMARKMSPFEHLGDDWNGTGGGNSDYGDPVYSIGDGVVVYSENYGSNWGQVVIVRHKYRDHDGSVRQVDSLYGHVINRRVAMGDPVRRGEQIAQIGSNNGMYLAHLHLEIRSNTDIGIQSWNYSKGLANYHRPDQFISRHRPGKALDASLRLASAPAEPKPEVVPAAAPAQATVKPVMVAAVATPSARPEPVTAKPNLELASGPSKGFFVSLDQESKPRTGDAVLRHRPVSRAVVDELASPVKRSNGVQFAVGKSDARPFFATERNRRSRKPVGLDDAPVVKEKSRTVVEKPRTVEDKTRASAGKDQAVTAKLTATRRRSFGKQ